MTSRLWRFLTTDISELLAGDAIPQTVEASQTVFELAEVLAQEGPNVAQLVGLVGQMDSLLDALNSPLAEIVEKSAPFISIATGVLKFYLQNIQRPLTLANCVALVSQVAYMESVKAYLTDDPSLLQSIGQPPTSEHVKHQTQKLADLEISDTEAQRAVINFPNSGLAQRLGEVLQARLVQAGLTEAAASQLTLRVAWRTPRYLTQVWAASAEAATVYTDLGAKR